MTDSLTRATASADEKKGYQVWLVRYYGWQPARWNDLPPESVAIEPALPGLMTRQLAADYIKTYNEHKLCEADNQWAVAVPLTMHYVGQPLKTQVILPGMLESFEGDRPS